MMHRSIRLSHILCMVAVIVAGLFFAAAPLFSQDSFDWRNVDGQNWITPVKDQFGGTCWAFASVGTIEAKYKLTRGDSYHQPDLSEQQLVWEPAYNDLGTAFPDTVGGNAKDSLTYMCDGNYGVVTEARLPYQPSSPDVGFAPLWGLTQADKDKAVRGAGCSTYITNNWYIGSRSRFVERSPGYLVGQEPVEVQRPVAFLGECRYRSVRLGGRFEKRIPGTERRHESCDDDRGLSGRCLGA